MLNLGIYSHFIHRRYINVLTLVTNKDEYCVPGWLALWLEK